jgi:SPP1 gp7 family putative phage head morphogenesis protein
MTTPLPPSELIRVLERFRRDAAKQDLAALKQLGSAYNKLYQRLSREIELEVRRVFDTGGQTVSKAFLSKRLADLKEAIEDELRKYANFIEATIDASTDDMLLLGGKQALELMRMATGGQKSLVGINFKGLNTDQIETIVGFLSTGSPLRTRIGQLGKFYADDISDKLVEAIALGYSPNKAAGDIAPLLAKVMDTSKGSFASVLATAVRMTRTAQLYTYREASRANYNANSDVVSGWQWYASLDERTCPACFALHGSIHELDEVLDGHYHCRCTPLPVILGNPLVAENAGTDWFENLSEAQQRESLGKGAFDAWQEGKFDLTALGSKQAPDDVYGQMHVTPSLKELVGE